MEDPLTMYLSDIYTIRSTSLESRPSASPAVSRRQSPIGLQILTPLTEDKLLRIARMYESKNDWHTNDLAFNKLVTIRPFVAEKYNENTGTEEFTAVNLGLARMSCWWIKTSSGYSAQSGLLGWKLTPVRCGVLYCGTGFSSAWRISRRMRSIPTGTGRWKASLRWSSERLS